MFFAFLDPVTRRIPVPRTPVRDGYGGTSLDVFSRCRKRKACGRVKLFPLWQCARMLLTLYIDLGGGKRCRSWRSDRSLMEIMKRSGKGCYSLPHVRRCRRLLEDVGLVRSHYVAPHYVGGCRTDGPCKGGHFPGAGAPDADGGGKRASKGGNVVEVNVAAILGEADLWPGPQRGTGWQDAREAREAARELASAWAPAGRLDGELSPSVDGACTAAQSGIMDDHGRVIMDAHSCDHSPPEKFNPGHGRSGAPGARGLPAAETPADAGRALRAPLDAAAAAAQASLDTPPPSGPRGPREESERQRTVAEQPSRQAPRPPALPTAGARRSGVVIRPGEAEVEIPGEALAWAEPAVRAAILRQVAPPPPAGAPTAGPPSLFDARELGPVGRHGEKPHGWRGPYGGGGGS